MHERVSKRTREIARSLVISKVKMGRGSLAYTSRCATAVSAPPKRKGKKRKEKSGDERANPIPPEIQLDRATGPELAVAPLGLVGPYSDDYRIEQAPRSGVPLTFKLRDLVT